MSHFSIFELVCPACGFVNQIPSTDPVIEWECGPCGALPITSLPTDDETGQLLVGP